MKAGIVVIALFAVAGCAAPRPPVTEPAGTAESAGTVAPTSGPSRSVDVVVGTNGSAVAVGSGNVTVGVGTGGRIGRGGRTGVGWWF
ncbi:hypothetical protein R3X27_19070 [Tropicimonas sp. TH_r6]|uniref:hypothetical protein n=1 Tax=Tropicimonas sp. TH_r6 TaxID=3082085 RepID=UPI00295466C7|nr:hypothetical protein [Tropicimonas sp. TH_r6]MDV7144787.1 hypothetical protein [Tropicimonas sp. TH_r6]